MNLWFVVMIIKLNSNRCSTSGHIHRDPKGRVQFLVNVKSTLIFSMNISGIIHMSSSFSVRFWSRWEKIYSLNAQIRETSIDFSTMKIRHLSSLGVRQFITSKNITASTHSLFAWSCRLWLFPISKTNYE